MSSTTATDAPTSSPTAQGILEAIRDTVTDIVAIDGEIIETLVIAMFAGGHSLIEGIPGIGKTLLARTMARCVDCDFRRIQFTNDLMPSDIVGTAIWRQSKEKFTFAKGPLFTNIVLADEINRTSPRTLSCLLEAMESGTVSIEGRVTSLGSPFLVWATRNPIEFHGTYPIPEAAIDRFLVRVELGYPSVEQEIELYQGRNPEDQLAELEPVVHRDDVVAMIEAAQSVRVSDPVARYCHRVVAATRNHEAVSLGASPRAAMSWLAAARARAFLNGRNTVLPDDLKAMAQSVLGHRIFLAGSGSGEQVIADVLDATPVEL